MNSFAKGDPTYPHVENSENYPHPPVENFSLTKWSVSRAYLPENQETPDAV